MIDWAAFKRARRYHNSRSWKGPAAIILAATEAIAFTVALFCLGLLAESVLVNAGPDSGALHRGSVIYGPLIAKANELVPQLSETPLSTLLLIGVSIVCAGICSLSRYLQNSVASRLVAENVYNLRRGIFNQTYRLGTTETQSGDPPETQFHRNTEHVRVGHFAWLTSCVRDPMRIVLLLALAITAHWSLALLFLVCAIMVSYFVINLVRRVQRRRDVAQEGAVRGMSRLEESIRMIRLTRGYLMEDFERERFDRNLNDFGQVESRGQSGSSGIRPLVGFMIVLGVSLVVGLATLNFLSGTLSAFETVLLYSALLALYWPVHSLWRNMTKVARGATAASRILGFLEQRSQLAEIAGARFLSPMSRSLEYRGVKVEKEGRPPLIDGLNLKIESGSRIAIMGLDEASKKAMAYLIPRFLDPSSGEVRIDGHDVRTVTLESLRAQVAMVMQDGLYFNDTIAANIGCGEKSYRLQHIIEASKIAHAHHFIQRLPRGYDTLIGNLGETLDAGQAYRIALARAILRDPSIMIVEEPRVALDEDTKNLLDDSIARMSRGRTMIFIPHRLSTIRSCDQILILHHGRIEAIGTHRELTMRSELYRHLQYTEFNVFASA